jgi:type II secretory pathway component GspD/PulD (secretin)
MDFRLNTVHQTAGSQFHRKSAMDRIASFSVLYLAFVAACCPAQVLIADDDKPDGEKRGKAVLAEESKAVTAEFAPSDKPGTRNARAGELFVTFNFKYAPWDLVLKKFAELSNSTLDIDEVPPGTFTYHDAGKHTVTEALDVINGYLLKKGFVLVRRDNFLVVHNLERPIPPNLIPKVPLSELPKRGRNELMSVVMPLGNIDAKSAAEEIKDLLGPYPQGKVLPMVATNQLFVTDIGSNLQQIHELLDGLGAVVQKGTTFKAFKLAHISATEAERVLREMFALPARGALTRTTTPAADQTSQRSNDRQNRWGNGFPFGGGGFPWGGGTGGGYPDFQSGRGNRGNRDRGDSNGDGTDRQAQPATPAPSARMSIAIDPRQNNLMVTCSVEDMRLVEETIKTIDVPDPEGGRGAPVRSVNEPTLRVYPLENADPAVVVDVLYATVPGIIIREDTKTRRVNVWGTPAEQEQVTEIVKQLDDGAGESVTVIPLRLMEAVPAAASLKSLFSVTRQDPPSIEADAAGRRLMIRGSPDQVAQIKSLLQQMGEDGNVKVASETHNSGPIRRVDTRGRSPAEVLGLVERLLPPSENSFIRIVPPSSIGVPAFRRSQFDDFRNDNSSEMRRRGSRTAPGVPSERPASASPEAGDGGPRRTGAKRASVATGTLPHGVYRDAAARAVREVPVEGVAFREADESAEIDDLSRQLENALREQDQIAGEDNSSAEASEPKSDVAEPARPSRQLERPARDRAAKPSSEPAELRMTVYDGKILMASTDNEALDRMERLIQALSAATAPRTKWTVYYLRVAEAAETATMLGHLFPEGSVTRATQTTGPLFGGLASLRTADAGLGSPSRGGALRIIPETRANALFISGPEDEVNQVMEALNVLDSAELPESLKDRVPRMIPVQYADVNDVAEIVKDVYKEHMDGGQQANNRQNQPQMGFNPMAMFMGGQQQQQQQGGRNARTVQLSIGVDARTNTLVVSASDSLFRQIEALVSSLDESAGQARRTVRVISMHNANSQIVQQTLSSLMGKVKTTSGAPSGASNGGRQPAANVATNSSAGTNQNNDQQQTQQQVDPTAQFMQQQMMRRMMFQGGGGGGFGRGGGGRGGGGGGGNNNGN